MERILLFAGLAYNLMSKGPLLQVDTAVYQELIAEAQTAAPVINESMIFGFFTGKQIVLLIVTILSIYFIYKRYWRELAMLLLSSAAGSIAWNLIIHYFSRPRPSVQTGLVVTTIPSFPSGHTMSTLIVYGFLAYLLIPKMPSRFWKWAVAIAAAVVILFVGFSRVFQGGHYLSDAIGGYALGLAWAGLVYLLIEKFSGERRVNNVHCVMADRASCASYTSSINVCISDILYLITPFTTMFCLSFVYRLCGGRLNVVTTTCCSITSSTKGILQ